MDNFCTYCSVIVGSEAELRAHCNSEGHQLTIMSDEGRDWKFRAPARGVGADQYTLCLSYSATGKCRFGQQCCDAHGEDELKEWKERFDYRQMKLQRAKECRLQGRHYTEQLLEKWLNSASPNQIMTENLDSVDVKVEPDVNLTVSEKNCCREWTFHIAAKATLHHIALLYETHRNHFRISQIVLRRTSDLKEYNLGPHCQEWSNTDNTDFNDDHYTVKVRFVTAIYGTFRQAVVFDFGFEPVLVQKLCVDVVSVSEMEKLQQARDTAVSFTERWSNTDVTIIPFENKPYPLGEKEECLLTCYPAPNGAKFTVTQSVMEPMLTKNNYCARQHELLCIEEMAQYELLSRYNVKAHLNLTSCYLLTPNSAITAKYAHNGELFANMQLSSVLSEDSASGRLVLTNCNTVLLAPVKTKGDERRKVYEAIIEDKGKTVIYIRLSKRCCEDLKLKPDRELLAEVQFQLNRLPLCEMHFAVDRLHPPSLVFPDVTIVPQMWTPNNNFLNADPRLNPKQKEAVQAIITPLSVQLPPVLIIGPFGTGKTFTLAHAVKMILEDPLSRVLVCTHSNSAADIYIREYLHPQVAEGKLQATPLRIYYRHRWVATVHPTVQQYCLVSTAGSDRTFNMPTIEDVKKHKVIVTTLSTSRYLVQLGLEKGFFTHILIDEAAQAMECEAIMPLSLANENTRIVLAGDHMQLSPEVYSQFAQQRNLHTSLLERLYDLYPEDFPCKVLLCENYRSHEAIIQYTSELFYDNHLQASGQQPRHKKYYPLTFFTARGEDVQDCNSTAFHNNAEVYEIVERVIELKKNWPKSWGEQDESSVGVVTPYYDQVVRIRAELRKKKLHGVSVERVLNVQGKQFRVIFLSAVRTRQTCGVKSKPESDLDHGFLSNARLLNTAITRAQSLVAVVGDPVSLCSVGKCRKLWEKFIFTCHKEKSLFGITWDSLRSQLDSMELKKNFILNPLAPEFIPGRMYHGQPNTSSSEPFCPTNPTPAPWFLLPFASPFQGPPLLQPAMAHVMSAPTTYNVINCLSLMPPPPPPPPPPQGAFQNFPYNNAAAAQRAAAIPPRIPTMYPRKISGNRTPVTETGISLKDFERGVAIGRQLKRNEGQMALNVLNKQLYGRLFEERNELNRPEFHGEVNDVAVNFQNPFEEKPTTFNNVPFQDQMMRCPRPAWPPMKQFPDSELNSTMNNDVEHFMRPPFNDANNMPAPVMVPSHPLPFAEKWNNGMEQPQNSSQVDNSIPNIHLTLQDKINLLEKALPNGTDILAFLDSEEHTKAFIYHMLSTQGLHAARMYLFLIVTIKKEHESLIKNMQMNGFAQKRLVNQRYNSPSRNIADNFVRNVPFPAQRPPMVNNHHPETFENHEHENLASPFSLPRIFSMDKSDSFFSNRQEFKPVNPQWENPNPNGIVMNRPNQENLPFDMSKLSLGGHRVMNGDVHPPEEFYNPFNNHRQLEPERARENQFWPQGPLPEPGSYLSRLRNLSSSVSNGEPNFSYNYEPAREDNFPPKTEESVNHITAGPLSMSYPDIPDILSKHISPNKPDNLPLSSKIIQKPMRSEIPTSNSFTFEIPVHANNNTAGSHYPPLSSEGMTYAKILRSQQQQ